MNRMIVILICFVYVMSFSFSLGLSRSNFPCHIVYDYTWVINSNDRWTVEGSLFPKNKGGAKKSGIG